MSELAECRKCFVKIRKTVDDMSSHWEKCRGEYLGNKENKDRDDFYRYISQKLGEMEETAKTKDTSKLLSQATIYQKVAAAMAAYPEVSEKPISLSEILPIWLKMELNSADSGQNRENSNENRRFLLECKVCKQRFHSLQEYLIHHREHESTPTYNFVRKGSSQKLQDKSTAATANTNDTLKVMDQGAIYKKVAEAYLEKSEKPTSLDELIPIWLKSEIDSTNSVQKRESPTKTRQYLLECTICKQQFHSLPESIVHYREHKSAPTDGLVTKKESSPKLQDNPSSTTQPIIARDDTSKSFAPSAIDAISDLSGKPGAVQSKMNKRNSPVTVRVRGTLRKSEEGSSLSPKKYIPSPKVPRDTSCVEGNATSPSNRRKDQAVEPSLSSDNNMDHEKPRTYRCDICDIQFRTLQKKLIHQLFRHNAENLEIMKQTRKANDQSSNGNKKEEKTDSEPESTLVIDEDPNEIPCEAINRNKKDVERETPSARDCDVTVDPNSRSFEGETTKSHFEKTAASSSRSIESQSNAVVPNKDVTSDSRSKINKGRPPKTGVKRTSVETPSGSTSASSSASRSERSRSDTSSDISRREKRMQADLNREIRLLANKSSKSSECWMIKQNRSNKFADCPDGANPLKLVISKPAPSIPITKSRMQVETGSAMRKKSSDSDLSSHKLDKNACSEGEFGIKKKKKTSKFKPQKSAAKSLKEKHREDHAEVRKIAEKPRQKTTGNLNVKSNRECQRSVPKQSKNVLIEKSSSIPTGDTEVQRSKVSLCMNTFSEQSKKSHQKPSHGRIDMEISSKGTKKLEATQCAKDSASPADNFPILLSRDVRKKLKRKRKASKNQEVSKPPQTVMKSKNAEDANFGNNPSMKRKRSKSQQFLQKRDCAHGAASTEDPTKIRERSHSQQLLTEDESPRDSNFGNDQSIIKQSSRTKQSTAKSKRDVVDGVQVEKKRKANKIGKSLLEKEGAHNSSEDLTENEKGSGITGSRVDQSLKNIEKNTLAASNVDPDIIIISDETSSEDDESFSIPNPPNTYSYEDILKTKPKNSPENSESDKVSPTRTIDVEETDGHDHNNPSTQSSPCRPAGDSEADASIAGVSNEGRPIHDELLQDSAFKEAERDFDIVSLSSLATDGNDDATKEPVRPSDCSTSFAEPEDVFIVVESPSPKHAIESDDASPPYAKSRYGSNLHAPSTSEKATNSGNNKDKTSTKKTNRVKKKRRKSKDTGSTAQSSISYDQDDEISKFDAETNKSNAIPSDDAADVPKFSDSMVLSAAECVKIRKRKTSVDVIDQTIEECRFIKRKKRKPFSRKRLIYSTSDDESEDEEPANIQPHKASAKDTAPSQDDEDVTNTSESLWDSLAYNSTLSSGLRVCLNSTSADDLSQSTVESDSDFTTPEFDDTTSEEEDLDQITSPSISCSKNLCDSTNSSPTSHHDNESSNSSPKRVDLEDLQKNDSELEENIVVDDDGVSNERSQEKAPSFASNLGVRTSRSLASPDLIHLMETLAAEASQDLTLISETEDVLPPRKETQKNANESEDLQAEQKSTTSSSDEISVCFKCGKSVPNNQVDLFHHWENECTKQKP